MHVLMVLALLGSELASADQALAPHPERLLFIVIDTLRADHLHYMGYRRQTSPWLDDFAAESVDFRNAISPSDGTQRSVPALMTGKFFSQLFREPIRSDGIPNSAATLAELFRGAGFRTVGWTTNPHVSRKNQYDQGFDEFRELLPHGVIYARIEHVIRDVRKNYVRSGRREFVYVHLMDVHSPYFPPAPYSTMWATPYSRIEFQEGQISGRDGRTAIGLAEYWRENHDVQQEDITHIISQYDGEIRYVDEYLPLLFDALNYNPARDLVVVTADHGEQFYEHGFVAHNKSTLLEELRVPLLVHYPAFRPRRVTTFVSLVDLLPTLCELFGLALPNELPGRSLVPALNGKDLSDLAIFAEGSDDRGPTGVVISSNLFYYLNTRVHSWMYPWRIWPVEELLFDLESDPLLTTNVLLERLEDADRMNALLRKLNRRFQNCDPAALMRAHPDVKFGSNMLAASSDVDEFVREDSGLRLECAIEEPNRAHLFEIDYTLDSGTMFIELRGGDDNLKFYSYKCLKRRAKARRLRVVVYPPSERTVLTVRVTGAGEGRITQPILRRAYIPELSVAPWENAAEPIAVERGLTEEERTRLEALGYLN